MISGQKKKKRKTNEDEIVNFRTADKYLDIQLIGGEGTRSGLLNLKILIFLGLILFCDNNANEKTLENIDEICNLLMSRLHTLL